MLLVGGGREGLVLDPNAGVAAFEPLYKEFQRPGVAEELPVLEDDGRLTGVSSRPLPAAAEQGQDDPPYNDSDSKLPWS